MVEEQITLQRRAILAMEQNEADIQTELLRSRRHLTTPIGLGVGTGDQRIGPFCHHIRKNIFELPRLVATEGKPRHVVPLDPDIRPAKDLGKALSMIKRRRQMGKTDPLDAIETAL